MTKRTDSNNPMWLDILCDDVNHYDAVPPASEWDKVVTSLDSMSATKSSPKYFLGLRLSFFIGGISAVAAILILGFFLFSSFGDDFQSVSEKSSVATISKSSDLPFSSSFGRSFADSIEVEVIKNTTKKNLFAHGVNRHLVSNKVSTSRIASTSSSSIKPISKDKTLSIPRNNELSDDKMIVTQKKVADKIDIGNNKENKALLNKRKKQQEFFQKSKEKNEHLKRENARLKHNFSRTRKHNIAIGLIADAGLINRSHVVNRTTDSGMHTSQFRMNYASAMNEAKGIKLYNLNDFSFAAKPSYSYQHKHPWNLGFSLAKKINSRFTLVSGINYTKLSALVTDEVDQSYFDQTVHYLSVPVAIQWSFIQLKQYNVYIALGTMLGRGVGARIDGKSVLVHGVQFSFNTSFGAQYFLLPQWSIFGEVGYAKFYDDDKRFETYFDIHSTNITFSFGVRWHL